MRPRLWERGLPLDFMALLSGGTLLNSAPCWHAAGLLGAAWDHSEGDRFMGV